MWMISVSGFGSAVFKKGHALMAILSIAVFLTAIFFGHVKCVKYCCPSHPQYFFFLKKKYFEYST